MIVVVHDFGGRNGMAILAKPNYDRSFGEVLLAKGFGYTWLTRYESYDRALFVEALSDRGWRGDGTPPDWYTGVPGDADD